MIRYTHQMTLEGGRETPPQTLAEAINRRFGLNCRTLDYELRWAQRAMYEYERAAAAYGTPIRFEYRVDRAKTGQVYLTITIIWFEGATFCDREENGYDDSDFYAVCWAEGLGRCIREDFASTRYGGGGTCQIDATPEVQQKAARWLAGWYREQATRQSENKAVRVERGKFVQVVKAYKPRGEGKIPALVGDYAYIFWEGEDRFSRGVMRFGIEFVGGDRDGEKTFVTGSHHFEVVNPLDYERPAADIEAHALDIEQNPRPPVHLPFVRMPILV